MAATEPRACRNTVIATAAPSRARGPRAEQGRREDDRIGAAIKTKRARTSQLVVEKIEHAQVAVAEAVARLLNEKTEPDGEADDSGCG